MTSELHVLLHVSGAPEGEVARLFKRVGGS